MRFEGGGIVSVTLFILLYSIRFNNPRHNNKKKDTYLQLNIGDNHKNKKSCNKTKKKQQIFAKLYAFMGCVWTVTRKRC